MTMSELALCALVRHKADLSEQNRKGQTPLIIAAETGQDTVVELLLHSGAALHLCDASSRSALEIALQAGHMGALRVLLQQSVVDVNGITKRGSSLLHLAAEIGDEARVTFLLSARRAAWPSPSSPPPPTSASACSARRCCSRRPAEP